MATKEQNDETTAADREARESRLRRGLLLEGGLSRYESRLAYRPTGKSLLGAGKQVTTESNREQSDAGNTENTEESEDDEHDVHAAVGEHDRVVAGSSGANREDARPRSGRRGAEASEHDAQPADKAAQAAVPDGRDAAAPSPQAPQATADATPGVASPLADLPGRHSVLQDPAEALLAPARPWDEERDLAKADIRKLLEDAAYWHLRHDFKLADYLANEAERRVAALEATC